MKKNNQSSNTGIFILGSIFGALLSAIVALLFAPKSGKDLRKDIGETTTKTLENTDEYLNLARQKGTEVIRDVEDAASNYFNLAEEKMKTTFSKTEKELDSKTAELDEMIDEAIEEIEDIEE